MSRRDRDDRDDLPRPLLALALVAVQVLLAATVWLQTFPARDVLPVLVAAAGVPVAITALVPSRRRGWPSVLLNVLAFVVVGLLLVATAPGGAFGSAATDLGQGLLHGWDDLLSTVVPASGDPSLLVVPFVLTWLAALVAAQIVTRSHGVVMPAVPAVVLLVAGRLATPTGAATSWAAAIGVAGVGLVLIAVRNGAARAAPVASADAARPSDAARLTDEDRSPAARRAGVLALPIALAVVVVAAVAGPVVERTADRPAVSLRQIRDRGVDVPPVQDPLDSFNATLAADPGAVRFTVDSSVPRDASARWLLVALDRYDGSAWSSSARYRRAGTSLPVAAAATDPSNGDAALDERDLPTGSAVSTTEVRQSITIGDLGGIWLPAATRPIALELADPQQQAAVDPASGTLILDDATLRPGMRYDVTSAVTTPTAAGLAGAALPSSPAFRRDLELPPGLPASINDATTTAMARAASPFQQAAALEAYFHGNGFAFDAQAPTGHSYGDLVRFLGNGRNAKRGTDEQFASAYVVMARARGLPARVAVGFRRGAQVDTTGTSTVQYRVTAADTAVWPEVYFAGIGWVPFDPVPTTGSTPPAPQDPITEEVSTGKARAAEAAATNQSVPPAANPILDGPGTTDDARPLWSWVLAGAVAAALAFGLFRVLLALVRRRRISKRRAARRSAGDPAQRVLGAWHEVVELLEQSGLDSLQASTVGDVGTAVADRWGEEVAAPVRALGALVNDAAFEPEPPAAAVADEAWRLEGAARAAVVGARKAHPAGLAPPAGPVAAPADAAAATPTGG
jgi:transglutaminase-like putative cysteine protease